jgi:uncharacterized membrane protein YbhN (UPF0104 family)
VTALWHTFTSATALLTHIRIGFALVALILWLASCVLVGARWRLILRALGATTSLWSAVVTYSAGVFVGNITPARTIGNDAARIALIRTRSDASVKAATASVVYDRISELPAVGVVALIALPALPVPLFVWVAIVIVLSLLAFVPPIHRAIGARISKWHDTIVGIPVGAGSVAAALACSMLVWTEDVTRNWLVAASFGVILSPSQAATLTSFRLISGLIPIPGGVGVAEGSAITAFLLFGVPPETATAITIIERGILYGCGTLLGGISLMLLGGRRVLQKRTQATALTFVMVACTGAAFLSL